MPADQRNALIEAVAPAVAEEKQTNGFKLDESGLYLEARIIKSAIKENVNIRFASQRWGPTKKGPKSFAAERVFIDPARIYLDRAEPDGLELFLGHVSGPRGPQSTLTYYEYVEGPRISFEVSVEDDCIKPEWWAEIWQSMQRNGLGALRSQGHGQFDIVRWERVG